MNELVKQAAARHNGFRHICLYCWVSILKIAYCVKDIGNKLLEIIGFPWAIVAVFVIGIVLRLYRYWRDPVISRDGIFYLNQAQMWLSKGASECFYEPNAWQPPLFLRLIQWGHWCGLNWAQAGIWWCFIFGVLAIAAIMWTLAGIPHYSRVVVLLGGALVATNPTMVKLSVEIQRESGFLFFFILFIGAALRGCLRRTSILWWFMGGVFIGGGILFRYESVDGFVLGCLLLWPMLKGRIVSKEWFCCMLAMGIGGIAMVLISSILVGIPLDFYWLAIINRFK